MTRRRRRSQLDECFNLPLLPFLSIMLGLISIMALTALGITARRREKARQEVAVKLVGTPAEFAPLNIRCMRRGIIWRDFQGRRHRVSLLRPPGNTPDLRSAARPMELEALALFLQDAERHSRRLSYDNRQHTLVLWIEPEGVMTSYLFRQLLQTLDVSLRVGMLPIAEDEAIMEVQP